MKNILLHIDNLGSGGAQNQISMLAVGLKQRGFEVTVLVYYAADFYKARIEDNNIGLVHIPKKDRMGINVIQGLKKTIKEKQIDVVISFLNTPNFYAAACKKLLGNKIKLITSHRSKTDFSKLSFSALQMRKWVNKGSDFIIANSVHEKETWVNKYPKLQSKMLTIYNGVDVKKFYPNSELKRNNTLLVVGSVGPAKNGLVVLEALKILIELGLQIKLLWIGKKQRAIKFRRDYIDEMEKKVEEYNLANHWTWMDAQSNIEQYYQSYKGLILASVVEGLPNVVCEAQSCGMPCLVSNTLDHPLLVQDGHNGYLFDPKDPLSLANAIEKFYALSNENLKLMEENSISSAKEKFSLNTFISSYEEVLEKC